MTNISLARSYLKKAAVRLEVLRLLQKRGAWSDVVREAQEAVELALKGMLRAVGVEPPKWHDVGAVLQKHAERFAPEIRESLPELVSASEWLRGERELSFYGDADFIPTEEYDARHGRRAVAAARLAVRVARRVIRVAVKPDGTISL